MHPAQSLGAPPLMYVSEHMEPWSTTLDGAEEMLATDGLASVGDVEDGVGRAVGKEDVDCGVGGDRGFGGGGGGVEAVNGVFVGERPAAELGLVGRSVDLGSTY